MLSQRQRLQLIQQAEKANLSEDEAAKLMKWGECISFANMALTMLFKGHIEVIGMDGPQPYFNLTDKGLNFVLDNMDDLEAQAGDE